MDPPPTPVSRKSRRCSCNCHFFVCTDIARFTHSGAFYRKSELDRGKPKKTQQRGIFAWGGGAWAFWFSVCSARLKNTKHMTACRYRQCGPGGYEVSSSASFCHLWLLFLTTCALLSPTPTKSICRCDSLEARQLTQKKRPAPSCARSWHIRTRRLIAVVRQNTMETDERGEPAK